MDKQKEMYTYSKILLRVKKEENAGTGYTMNEYEDIMLSDLSHFTSQTLMAPILCDTYSCQFIEINRMVVVRSWGEKVWALLIGAEC